MSLPTDTVKKLSAPLDMRRVHEREGSRGMKLSYLASHDVIRYANAIFGYGQWGHEVVDLTCIGSEPVKSAKGAEGQRVGYRCTVVLSVVGAIPTSGVGYGDAQEYNGSLITPHELAAKEAESDALKRALKNYGDQFGLLLYAKPGAERDRVEREARIRAERAAAQSAPDPGTGPEAAADKQGEEKEPAAPAPAQEPSPDPSEGQQQGGNAREAEEPGVVNREPSEKPEAAGPTSAAASGAPPAHAQPFLLDQEQRRKLIADAGGQEVVGTAIVQWDKIRNAQTLGNRVKEISNVPLIRLLADHEARNGARKGLLGVVGARLDHLADVAARDLTAANEQANIGVGDPLPAEAVGADPPLNESGGGLSAAAAAVPEDGAASTAAWAPAASLFPAPAGTTPVDRLRALIAFVADQPSVVPNSELWTTAGILAGVAMWGPRYAKMTSLDELGDEDVAAVWKAVPADVRSHLEALSPADVAALAGNA